MWRTRIIGLRKLTEILCAAWLWGVGTAQAEPSVTIWDQGHGAYQVVGHFDIQTPEKIAWDVLTDYEAIPRFVSSMKESHIQQRNENHVLIKQVASAKLMWFSKRIHVLLRVNEKPVNTIEFEDVAAEDFTYYRGSWELWPSEKGLDVHYQLECQRRFMVPNALAKRVMKRDAEDLMVQIRQEMIRRSTGGVQ